MQIDIQARKFPLTDVGWQFIICFNSKKEPGVSW